MSKKYFINNLDTAFGQALISELVKQPVQEPVHMCTVKFPADSKPNGNTNIIQVLKKYSSDKSQNYSKKKQDNSAMFTYII